MNVTDERAETLYPIAEVSAHLTTITPTASPDHSALAHAAPNNITASLPIPDAHPTDTGGSQTQL